MHIIMVKEISGELQAQLYLPDNQINIILEMEIKLLLQALHSLITQEKGTFQNRINNTKFD